MHEDSNPGSFGRQMLTLPIGYAGALGRPLKLPYKERLISSILHTLKYRRLRADTIEVFKIRNDVYDAKVAPTIHFNNTSVTRSNKFRYHNETFTHNFIQYFFSARIVNIRNTLPNWVVDVQSIDMIKLRLDRFGPPN